MSSCQGRPTGKHTAIFGKPVGEFVWSAIKDLLLYDKGFSMFSVRNPILFCGGKTMKRFQKNEQDVIKLIIP